MIAVIPGYYYFYRIYIDQGLDQFYVGLTLLSHAEVNWILDRHSLSLFALYNALVIIQVKLHLKTS